MYKLRLDKYRATWHYFLTNPQGGGFGSNHCGSQRVAWAKAISCLSPGTEYEVVVNGTNRGVHRKE